MAEQPPVPGEAIRRMLTERGWTQEDLARIIGRHRPEVTNLISGKRSITPDLAIALGTAFSNPPQYWMELETARQLSFAQENPIEIQRRLRLYQIAPVKDMQKRGWIPGSLTDEQLAKELCRFFGVTSLDPEPSIAVATRRGEASATSLSPAQRAWCFRALQVARLVHSESFKANRLDEAEAELRRLASYPDEARHVPKVLADYGIRFVVVEPLPSARIDGATLWIDGYAPVIALSLRCDRIDWFWHTLMHEFSHVRHGDAFSVDEELVGEAALPSAAKEQVERRADEEAASTLIPEDKLESFIVRVGPLYSKPRINQFANRMQIHPGVVVGQLQHRGELGWHSNREMLGPIRRIIIETALVDGWGQEIGGV